LRVKRLPDKENKKPYSDLKNRRFPQKRLLYTAFKVNTGKVIEMYSSRHSKRQFYW